MNDIFYRYKWQYYWADDWEWLKYSVAHVGKYKKNDFLMDGNGQRFRTEIMNNQDIDIMCSHLGVSVFYLQHPEIRYAVNFNNIWYYDINELKRDMMILELSGS